MIHPAMAATAAGAPRMTTEEGREAFLARYRHLVRYVVDRLRVSITGVFDDDDAAQAGMLGLLSAQSAYRPDAGASFETYAILRIRGAILDAVRSLDPLGRPGRDAAKAIAHAAGELASALGREATEHEIAGHLGITVERCRELRRVASLTIISLDTESDAAVGSPDGCSNSLRETVADPQAVDPLDWAARNEELTSLVGEVAMLGDRNRRVIALYYRDELTFREIARVLGVSESRACQIHRSALDGLRDRLAPPATAGTQPA